ncbi:MAG: hypothetical protein Pg6C_12390 [Treponemataceae bacterium]|nr:MAG: hypothetical protein Pg6C_12390 [Treponemataceae bacterium]
MGKKIVFGAAATVFIALLAATSAFSLLTQDEARGIFYFPGPGGRIYTEIRWLPQSGDAEFSILMQREPAPERYVAELLLGPENARCKPLFNPNARALSCFESDGILYVDLSTHALYPEGAACAVKEGAELLEKNVLRNFKHIRRVSLFIGGKKAFEEFE